MKREKDDFTCKNNDLREKKNRLKREKLYVRIEKGFNMKKFKRKFGIVACLFLVIFASGNNRYSFREAMKVKNILDKIRAEQKEEAQRALKEIVITESEFNSYIAYLIEVNREKVMRELRLKLFKENKIEGKIFIDLTGQDIPKFLRPQMTFYFKGNFQVENGRAKINIKKLFLEDQPIPPLILDLIIYISSQIQNFEASSINDWYELPYGIINIETKRGRAIISY